MWKVFLMLLCIALTPAMIWTGVTLYQQHRSAYDRYTSLVATIQCGQHFACMPDTLTRLAHSLDDISFPARARDHVEQMRSAAVTAAHDTTHLARCDRPGKCATQTLLAGYNRAVADMVRADQEIRRDLTTLKQHQRA